MESSQDLENKGHPTDLTGGVALPWEKPGTAPSAEASDAPAGPLEIEAIQRGLPGIKELSLVRELGDYCHYGCEDTSGRALAVHIFPGGFHGPSESDSNGFLSDKEVALELKCRSVIGIEECVEIDGRKVVVTELPKGKILFEWRRQENLSPDRVLAVGNEICKAVARVHAAGLSHRCLNPAAIYVGDDDEVKILGPGLANLFYSKWRDEIAGRAQDESGSKIEIDDYLAPEVRKGGLGQGDHRSDVWSLGAILYELCMGHPPRGFLFDMSSSSVPVPENYAAALLRAMENDRRHRTDSVARLIDQLDGVEKPPPPPEFETEALEAPAPVKKRKRAATLPAETTASDPAELRKYSAVDGVLAQCGGPALLGFLAIGLVAGGLFAAQAYLRHLDKNEIEMSEDSEGILGKLRKARALVAVGRSFEAVELVREAAAEAEVTKSLFEKMREILLQTGRYDATVGILDRYLGRGVSSAPDLPAMTAEWNLTKGRIRSFLAAMQAAEAAREENNDYLEHEALSRAWELIPADEETGRKLARNPVHVYTKAVRKLAELKKDNPRQKNWRYHLWVQRSSVWLDLSGNRQLQSIVALDGLPLTELDLSGTGVSDLRPLADSDLEVLRIDDAPVNSLDALAFLPLQVLTFENCALHTATLPESLEDIQVLRGDVGGERVVQVGQPMAGRYWENELGMRFRPVGKGEVLVSVWETRARDFQKFLNEKRRGQARMETPPDMVVTGVSFKEAEEFCEWLTARDRERGLLEFTQSYRLPTDFEWSLAAARYENPLLTPGVRAPGEQHGRIASPEDRKLILELSEGIPLEAGEGAGRGSREVGGHLSWHGFHDLRGNAREWCGNMPGQEGAQRIVRSGEGLEVRTFVLESRRDFDLGFRVVLEAAPPPDYGALRSLVRKGRWEEAQDLALRRAIGDVVPAVREAGRAYLELRPLIGGGDRSIPDSVVGVSEFEGRKYYVARLPLSWDEAREFAEALGGHLVTVTSKEEHRWIEEELLNAPGGGTFWLGATIRPGAGSWGWVTREPWIFNRVEENGGRDTTRGLVLGPRKEEASPKADDSDADAGAEAGSVWLSDDTGEAHCFIVEWEPRKSEESLAASPRSRP